jgi:hypothetical protein
MKILNFFKRKIKSEPVVQTVPSHKTSRPFEEIKDYPWFSSESKSISDFEINLYSMLKNAIPIIDAAILKIVRLIGSFKINCENENISRKINNFFENVKVGPCGTGIENFIASYLNQLLTYGTAVGEIVMNSQGITALYNASLKNVELKPDENALKILICVKKGTKFFPVKNPELIFISVLNPEPGRIYGNSIMKGLPFISGILLKIFTAIGNNWERVGDARFALIYKPPADSYERACAKERAAQIASQWSRVMKSDVPSDFVAVGDIDIKVIGADNQILDSRIPVRQILEQIISKLSIPPFLLGISWSTTETMSNQQADLLTSELDSYRRILNPVINKICRVWLRTRGLKTEFEINWQFINFKDEMRCANARLLNAKAEKIEFRNSLNNRN